MLPTFGQGAAQAFEDAAALGKCFELHGRDIYRALLHYERVRYYRATRFQFASEFLFKHLEPEDTPQRRQILAAVNERDYPVFDHTERAGSDNSWNYAFDAPRSATSCRSGSSGRGTSARGTRRSRRPQEVARSLWKPAKPWTGDRPVTREELAQHATFDDCWVVIRGKVYDFTGWKTTTRAGPSSRACTAARTPRRSSATTTAGSPSGTCSTSASGRSSEPPPSAPATRRRSSPSTT